MLNKKSKFSARVNYRNRKIDQFIKWSIENRGYVKFKDIVRLHDEHNINIV